MQPLQKYTSHLEGMRAELEEYFAESEGRRRVLLMDGTGMLSSYQNGVLSALGPGRLDSFDEIHLVSGSTYAFFIYLAMQEGEFLWKPEDIHRWNGSVRHWHGVTPVLSLLRFLAFRFTRQPAGRFGGHATACRQIFSERFLARTLSSFPENYFFWTYSLKDRRLVQLNARSRFGELTVPEVVSMASCVPAIFGVHEHRGERFMDAMYAPGYGRLKYQLFPGAAVLHPNMYKTGKSQGIHSLKIHEHADGNKLIQRDFYRFLLGLRNPEFELVTRHALYGMQS